MNVLTDTIEQSLLHVLFRNKGIIKAKFRSIVQFKDLYDNSHL